MPWRLENHKDKRNHELHHLVFPRNHYELIPQANGGGREIPLVEM
jgi:hypothetical protein